LLHDLDLDVTEGDMARHGRVAYEVLGGMDVPEELRRGRGGPRGAFGPPYPPGRAGGGGAPGPRPPGGGGGGLLEGG
jgi:hypothetical protein